MTPEQRELLRWAVAATAAAVLSACAAPSEEEEEATAVLESGAGADPATGWPLALEVDFTSPVDLGWFALSDPTAWRIGAESGRDALELTGPSAYEPPYRSPHSLAVLAAPLVREFVLEVDLCSTGRVYGHRDLCLVFGFVAPDRYHYAHLATTPDERAHNVFLVAGADRRPLAPVAERGVVWGEDVWHRARLERREGRVRVLLDGTEVLGADVSDPAWGRVGLGSFDDTGRFARLRLWSPGTRTPDRALLLSAESDPQR